MVEMTAAEKLNELTDHALVVVATLPVEARETFYRRWTGTLPKLTPEMIASQVTRARHYKSLMRCGLIVQATPQEPRIKLTPLGKLLIELMAKDKRLRTWEK